MSESSKTDVIVVGAGPAGVSAAITVARGGKKVVLVERGNFSGAKNVYGGVIYSHAAKEIFPNFKEAPIERFVNNKSFMLLSEYDSTTISYKNSLDEEGSFIALRAKWDKWCVEQAKKEGVYFAPETTVRNLIVENGAVVGIETDLERFYADIVILADGVNSLLSEQIGLKSKPKAKQIVLAVKEVIKLPQNVIEQRFGLIDGKGAEFKIAGGPLAGLFAMGLMFTNKDSVAIGIGASLEDLKSKKIAPYELLEDLKYHPSIAPYLKDGELIEYSAHLIPEGGFDTLPKLYSDGVMVTGDAAALVNNVHFEGTNLAMFSGKFAGETALEAIEKNDFSSNMLCLYEKKLKNSFVMKDLKTYKDVVKLVSARTDSFLGYYPQKVNEFFEIFTSANGIEKKGQFVKFTKNFFCKRSLAELFNDAVTGIKLIFGVLK